MTFDIIAIASILTPIVALIVGVILFIRAKNALSTEHERVSRLSRGLPEDLRTEIKELRDQVDRFNLKNAELEEFVTRNMNKMAGRATRADKNLEKYEYLKELMDQSQELENSDQAQTNLFSDSNLNHRRLRRKQ